MPDTKAPELPKAPAPAVVERAQEKIAEGAELNQREEKALTDQQAIDEERGYRRILWKPDQGIYLLQHIATQHTTPDTEGGELEMRRWHNEYRMSQLRG